jgi:imidazolonepropionase-like amidohydrolase
MMKSKFTVLLSALALLNANSVGGATDRPQLSARVRPFVTQDASVIALTHVRVVDGTGAAARTDQTLVIKDGGIIALGDAAATKIPDGAKVLDLTGRTVIPGLVGMHDHMYYPAPGRGMPLYPEHGLSFPRLYLAGGVTSIRTTGSVEPYTDLELKRAIDAGEIAGPKIHVTGPYLEGEGAFTPQMHQLKDADDARRTVEFWITQGVTSLPTNWPRP